jgi:hypothetical protein
MLAVDANAQELHTQIIEVNAGRILFGQIEDERVMVLGKPIIEQLEDPM